MEGERPNPDDGNGGTSIKLPVGFRFHPTDEELLLHYLSRKVRSLPLPPAVIRESDVFRTNPWDLPGELKERRYFFCKSKRKRNVKKSKCRSTDGGFWKPTGKEKHIVVPGSSNIVIGIRKSFMFYQVDNSLRLKTQWLLHEFCLVCSITTPYLTQKVMVQMGEWVVCCVYRRKKKGRNNDKKSLIQAAGDDDMKLRIDQSSCCCSGITEISDLDQEEESSSSHNIN